MEFRRKSHFSQLKKLTVCLIGFCFIMFILFNYIAGDNQFYWKSNQYNYMQTQFFKRLVNKTKNDLRNSLVHSSSKLVFNQINQVNHVNQENQLNHLNQENQLNHVNQVDKVNRINEVDELNQVNPNQILDQIEQFELNKSSQLIGLKKKGRLINQNESNSRFQYLNLINHSSTNRSLVMKSNRISYDQMISNKSEYQFDLFKNDVIIFLHIQKTGGTSFGKRLVYDLKLNKPCECFKDRKHCSCIRPTNDELNRMNNQTKLTKNDKNMKTNKSINLATIKNNKTSSKYWLFSRYSTGWICGLHADFTQLNYCAEDALNRIEKVKLKRRYFFISILREPVARFLSEYGHVRRGATWRTSRYACSTEFENLNENSDELIRNNNSKSINSVDSSNETRLNGAKCYSGNDWRDVDLDDYINCDTNLAINRQTRMLADLSRVGCLNNNQTEYNRLLLESAKFNLKRLAFFGLLEYQTVSQFVFETVFNLTFKHNFIQLNTTHSTLIKTNKETVDLIRKLNYLDVELYEYAKKILFKRFEKLKKINDFEEFKKSKLNSLDNFDENLNRFPELRLLKKRFKSENDSISV